MFFAWQDPGKPEQDGNIRRSLPERAPDSTVAAGEIIKRCQNNKNGLPPSGGKARLHGKISIAEFSIRMW
jgi:hypothetical protein